MRDFQKGRTRTASGASLAFDAILKDRDLIVAVLDYDGVVHTPEFLCRFGDDSWIEVKDRA
jgi:hypothetical protein